VYVKHEYQNSAMIVSLKLHFIQQNHVIDILVLVTKQDILSA